MRLGQTEDFLRPCRSAGPPRPGDGGGGDGQHRPAVLEPREGQRQPHHQLHRPGSHALHRGLAGGGHRYPTLPNSPLHWVLTGFPLGSSAPTKPSPSLESLSLVLVPPTVPELVNGNTLTAAVVGLNAWVEYEFRVVARNAVGMGPPSPPSAKTRTEDASRLTLASREEEGGGGYFSLLVLFLSSNNTLIACKKV